MEIEVKKLSNSEIKKMGIDSWPIWEKEISRFDWYYDQTEDCLLLEGKVIVTSKDGIRVEFGKGDFVTFPKGLACTWDIKEPVKKHYNFRQVIFRDKTFKI
ncbi:MAG: cupin domain-containing protein [Candidatus Omnitrophica bacterium]|nr:cupin domain-containing protein [Candidatus Omnitrophota bacterium]